MLAALAWLGFWSFPKGVFVAGMTEVSDGQLASVAELWARYDAGEAGAVLAELSNLPKAAESVYWTLKGLAAVDAGEPAAAAEALRLVLEREPENPVAQLFLVLALFQSGEDVAAGEQLGRTILFPHHGFLRRFLKTFWPLRFSTSLGAWPENVEAAFSDPFAKRFEELSKAGGKPARRLAEKYFNWGVKAFHGRKEAEARHCFSRARALAPDNEMAAAHYAYLELLHNNATGAKAALDPLLPGFVEEFEKDRTAYPAPDTIVCYAWCLHEMGRQGDAIRALSAVEPEGPEDFGAHFVAAVCWVMMENDEAFERAYEKAMVSYFIDTWEQLMRPFLLKTGAWLRAGGRKIPRGDGREKSGES